MNTELGAIKVDTSLQDINVKNATDILSRGSKAQITHLFNVYNAVAKKGRAPLLTTAELQDALSSRGFKGYGHFGSAWDIAAKIGTGLLAVGAVVGPMVLQKYQIDKMPSVTPATNAAVSTAAVPSGPRGGETDWTTMAMYGGGALLFGGVVYMVLKKKRK